MVVVVQHPNSHDFKEIVKSHIHLDMEMSDFDDIIKLFLSGKAKPVFNKLKSLMFNRLYTE